MDRFGWLHLYGQHLWHDDASICGTREGIELLRDALTAALDHPDGVAMAGSLFAADGEGYYVNVHVLPEGEFQRLACPYTDEVAQAPAGAFWPWHLPVRPKRPTPPAPTPQEVPDGGR